MLIKFNSVDRTEKTVGSAGTVLENLLRQVKEERDNTTQTHSCTQPLTHTHTPNTHAEEPCYSSQSYLNILPLKEKKLMLLVCSNVFYCIFNQLFDSLTSEIFKKDTLKGIATYQFLCL